MEGSYDARLNEHVEVILQQEEVSNHSFLTHAKYSSKIDRAILLKYCEKVANVDDKADFVLIKLIRLLYFSGDAFNEAHDIIFESLSNFPFWVRKDKSNDIFRKIENIVFWSENHTFMFLSSAHLFHQKAKQLGKPSLVEEREESLLKAYLNAHSSFEGVYETLSCTYLPYTICSLLNLFDFSEDGFIRDLSSTLLQSIISQFLMVTNVDGICNISASARQYPAFRFRNTSHNVNQLIRLCTGRSPDPIKATSISEFLLTSSFRLENSFIAERWMYSGFVRQKANHSIEKTKDIYHQTGIDSLDLTPFYWSAGLVTHPKFIASTKAFQQSYDLHKLPGIKYLDMVPTALAEFAMESYNSLSSGQNYTGIELNIFKSRNGKVVMSSFENFNVNLRSYQQNPWMANIAGAPMWSQSGSLGQKLIPCFNDYCPAVSQGGNLLLVSYSTPRHRESIVRRMVADNLSFVTWPRQYFEIEIRQSGDGRCGPAHNNVPGSVFGSSARSNLDDEIKKLYLRSPIHGFEKNSWWFGRRLGCFVGLYCSQETTEVCNEDKGFPKMQMFSNDPKNFLPRRVCENLNHSWVIVVGDEQSHQNFHSFIYYCQRIAIKMSRDDRHSTFTTTVTDGDWHLHTYVEK